MFYCNDIFNINTWSSHINCSHCEPQINSSSSTDAWILIFHCHMCGFSVRSNTSKPFPPLCFTFELCAIILRHNQQPWKILRHGFEYKFVFQRGLYLLIQFKAEIKLYYDMLHAALVSKELHSKKKKKKQTPPSLWTKVSIVLLGTHS